MKKQSNAVTGIKKIISKLLPAEKSIKREQLLCIAAALLLAVISLMAGSRSSAVDNGNSIKRATPGEADKNYELSVGGISDSDEAISIKVSSREYSETEAVEQFDRLMEELSVHITGSNESLDKIVTDMVLPKHINGFNGITLSWFPEDTELIAYDGTVDNLELKVPRKTKLNVRLRAGRYSDEFSVPVTVYPADSLNSEDVKRQLEEMIKKEDAAQISSDRLVLPESINGHALNYEERHDNSWVSIIAAGLIAAFLLGLKPEQTRRKREKVRETELLLGYSEMVSKLMVYMGAGLAVRNAWIRIAENYNRELSAGMTEKNIVYDEMLQTAGELKRGVSETKAYADFAKRCPQKCYIKLISLLEQELKTGDPRVKAAMEIEMNDAFEQRKNMAKRLGEEAGTKLMLPLMLSLITVLIIVAVPAMMTLA